MKAHDISSYVPRKSSLSNGPPPPAFSKCTNHIDWCVSSSPTGLSSHQLSQLLNSEFLSHNHWTVVHFIFAIMRSKKKTGSLATLLKANKCFGFFTTPIFWEQSDSKQCANNVLILLSSFLVVILPSFFLPHLMLRFIRVIT